MVLGRYRCRGFVVLVVPVEDVQLEDVQVEDVQAS